MCMLWLFFVMSMYPTYKVCEWKPCNCPIFIQKIGPHQRLHKGWLYALYHCSLTWNALLNISSPSLTPSKLTTTWSPYWALDMVKCLKIKSINKLTSVMSRFGWITISESSCNFIGSYPCHVRWHTHLPKIPICKYQLDLKFASVSIDQAGSQ